jgi:flagellar biosynthesis protein FlhA
MTTVATILPDTPFLRKLSAHGDVLLAGVVIMILALMIIPLPPVLLDVLLTLNITLSILLLMVAMYITHPLELSVFPGLLLLLTIFRLSLNIASTRLILGEGYAGEVIAAFGSFVVKGNYVVGFIIFLILVLIQFVVIVKGAGRIAEVAARFTLDAMPGKQMAIDADMNAGLITEKEARERRALIAREAEFYGAMDGASKFVKGDAIAGLLINVVNIVGGLVIGVVQKGMPFSDALHTYTMLTVGDGLVSQIPALVIATAAGMVVTRSASGTALDIEMRGQLFGRPKAIFIASGALFLFAVLPGLPTVPFLMLAALMGAVGYVSLRSAQEQQPEKKTEVETPKEKQEQIEDFLHVDPIELEIGYGLIALVDDAQGGDLFQRIGNIRKQVAMELGILIPPLRVRDNLQLDPNEYLIKIRGNIVARSSVMMDRYLAVGTASSDEVLDGVPTTDPAFQLPAVWITPHQREQAELLGYTVVEPAAVLGTHLKEVLRRNADKILSRQDTKKLIENLKRDYPAVVEEMTPEVLPVGTVQKVLQNLLKEGIPVRDLVTILEALLDYARITKNVDVLTEYVRHSLSETIARLYRGPNGIISAIALNPRLEQILTSALQSQREGSASLSLAPEVVQELHRSLKEAVETAIVRGVQPIVLCTATVRPYFYRLIHTAFPTVAVLSFSELPPETEIEFIATIEVSHAN